MPYLWHFCIESNHVPVTFYHSRDTFTFVRGNTSTPELHLLLMAIKPLPTVANYFRFFMSVASAGSWYSHGL